MMRGKEREILNIFKSSDATISGQIDDSNIADQSQLLPVSVLLKFLLIGVC